MTTTFIYALKDPQDGEIRYIGKSNNPKGRFSVHVWEARRSEKRNHRVNWIRKILDKGGTPELEVIDEIPFQYWQALEAAYIQFFRESGCDLVNGTDGGDGTDCTGRKYSQATILKMRKSHSEKILSESHKRNIGKASLGNKHNLGRKQSPEEIERRISKIRGRKQTPEQINSRMEGRWKVKISKMFII